jgi:rare lipoprotein A
MRTRLSNSLVRRSAWLMLLAGVLLTQPACRKKPKLPAGVAPRGTEIGIASWYGHPYHGRAAASGEIYDMEKLTAAHRTLAFGTVVRVRNLDNGRSVDVRINDRGPFVDGRIIDLSRAAARKIDMIGPGTAKVRLEILALPAAAAQELYAVQVGAFRDRQNAERLAERLRRRFGAAQLVRRDGDPVLWRVLVGRERDAGVAAALADRLRGEFSQAFVVRLDAPAR